MKTSESIKNIAAALCKAQAEMKGAKMDAANPFFNSKYANLAEVIRAVSEPFANNSLSFVQSPGFVDGMISVTTRIIHVSGEWIEGETILPPTKNDAQGYGSAITYGKRYGLQAMAGVPSVDDDGNAAVVANLDYERLHETAAHIIDYIANEDHHGVAELWMELDKEEMEYLWKAKTKGGFFTMDEKAFIRQAKQEAA